MKKNLYLTILLLFFGLLVQAQNQKFSVKSFDAAPMDMTASSLDGKRIDQNNEVAALIKIVTTETGFNFEAGALGVVDSQQRTGEIWVWVPRASRKITIMHQKLGVLRDYRYPVEIQAERTYIMVLETVEVPSTPTQQGPQQQYLAFQITPPNATLQVEGKFWPVEADGSAQDYVNFGTYEWHVQAANYHPDAGRITVNDPDNTQVVTVNLKPNFGWIEVAGTGSLKDANVYVDNTLVGKAPCKSEALKSGPHNVRIVKKMYANYSETVTVSDNETTRLAPNLAADFAEVTLKVDADAEIWVNNEKKGTRSWTGPLGSGTYKIECKQTNHETNTVSQEITAAMAGQTITLPAPKPIYGSLMVESSPSFAKLFIDGKDMGNTPKSINEILIGQHELRVTKDGYAEYRETVTIAKGERKQVKATLSNGKEIQFTCNVPDAQLEIDGQRVGSASGTYQISYGSHSLKATATDYHDYTYSIIVSETSGASHNITMQAIRKAPEGALVGMFSVSPTQKVYFSQGNLQYQASTNTWRFAENQWDYLGDANKNISSSYNGWIDLFGWGTGNNPINVSTKYSDYSTFSDWGNKIGGGWRTLTKYEWKYVFDERRTRSGIRYAKATVNGVCGVILLPDDWRKTFYKLSKTNTRDASYNSNSISSSTWNSTFAPAGAVFLPAAGERYGASVGYVGSYGHYWSASARDSDDGGGVDFRSDYLYPIYHYYRYNGFSVRLVTLAEK